MGFEHHAHFLHDIRVGGVQILGLIGVGLQIVELYFGCSFLESPVFHVTIDATDQPRCSRAAPGMILGPGSIEAATASSSNVQPLAVAYRKVLCSSWNQHQLGSQRFGGLLLATKIAIAEVVSKDQHDVWRVVFGMAKRRQRQKQHENGL